MKKQLASLLGVAAQLALEKLIAALEEGKLPNGVMPIATGILIDKYRQFEGKPTQTIEVRKTVTLGAFLICTEICMSGWREKKCLLGDVGLVVRRIRICIQPSVAT